jgi:Flp pilus assembly protein TadD
VAFTLNAAKLAWKLDPTAWAPAAAALARRAARAVCGPRDHSCAEQPMASELEVLALTRVGRYAEAEVVLRRLLTAHPDDFERAYDLWVLLARNSLSRFRSPLHHHS